HFALRDELLELLETVRERLTELLFLLRELLADLSCGSEHMRIMVRVRSAVSFGDLRKYRVLDAEAVGFADGTADEPAQDVAGLGIRRNHALREHERCRAHMVEDDTHRLSGNLVFSVSLARARFKRGTSAIKDIYEKRIGNFQCSEGEAFEAAA